LIPSPANLAWTFVVETIMINIVLPLASIKAEVVDHFAFIIFL
jgi:hypothetical protein